MAWRAWSRLLGGPKKLLGGRSALAGPAAVVVLGVVAFAVLGLSAPSAHGAIAPVSTSPADIKAGEVLYVEHCQSCHGVSGVGGSNGSPELITVGAAAADFYLTTGRMPLNNVNNQALRHPQTLFDAAQIHQLDAYVNALPAINHANVAGPTIPTALPLCSAAQTKSGHTKNCVTLSQGYTYFATNCAQCHQSAGAGGMLSQGQVVPSLHGANITQVLEAIRVGPKPMPIFGTNTLSASQASAVAHYVEYLRKPNNRGGLGLGGFGPVGEGFVGIIVGLGSLLLLSRLIGNRG